MYIQYVTVHSLRMELPRDSGERSVLRFDKLMTQYVNRYLSRR